MIRLRLVFGVGLVIVAIIGTVPVGGSDVDPHVEWHSPFTDEPLSNETIQLDDGTVRLNATVDEPIERVEIDRRYTDSDGANDRDFRQVESLNNITVHAGGKDETEIMIRTFGSESPAPRITEFTVDVTDETPPNATLETERIDNQTVRLVGTVRDETQPQRLTIDLPAESDPVVHARGSNREQQTLGGIDIAKNSFSVSETFPAPDSANVTVQLEDRAGNTKQLQVPLPESSTPTPPATATAAPPATATATSVPTVTPTAASSSPTPTPTRTATQTTPAATPTPSTDSGSIPYLWVGLGIVGVAGWLIIQY
jgi:hypothetical protein